MRQKLRSISSTLSSVTSTLQEEWSRQQGHLFLWVPLIFACGIALYFSRDTEPSPTLAICISILASFSFVLSGWFYMKDSPRPYFLLFMVIGILCAGFSAAIVNTRLHDTKLIEKDVRFLNVEGTIKSIASHKHEKAKKLRIEDITFPEDERRRIDLTQIRVTSYHANNPQLNEGDRVQTLVRLMAPSPPLYPGGYDFQRHAYFDGISAYGFTMRELEIVKDTEQSSFTVSGVRDAIENTVKQSIPNPAQDVAVALLTGERDSLPESIKENLRGSGLAHLLAISGLHVGLVAGFFFFLVRGGLCLYPQIALYWPIKKIAAFIAICAAFSYMVLVGATLPTQRAFIMSGLVLLAVMLDRSALSLRLVAVAALLVLTLAPDALLSVSFQLSFAAVLGLIAFYDGIGRDLMLRNGASHTNTLIKIGMYCAGIMVTSLIATLSTSLFTAYHFNQFTVYGVIANVLAIPVVAFVVMPLGLIGIILMPVSDVLSGYAYIIMGYGIQAVLSIAETVSSWPYAVIPVAQISFICFVGAVVGFVFLCLWRGRTRLLGIPIMVIFLIASPVLTKRYDLLVSDTAESIYLPTENTYYGQKIDSFTRNNWQSTYGHVDAMQENQVSCDIDACRLEIKNTKISLVFTPLVLPKECLWADIIISGDPIPKKTDCAASIQWDRFDAWRHGASGLMVKNGTIITRKNAYDLQGVRPWSQAGLRARD